MAKNKVKCSEVASSGKWRIGTTGAPKFNNEEDCLDAWYKMNGGSSYITKQTAKNSFKPKTKTGKKTTIIRRNSQSNSR